MVGFRNIAVHDYQALKIAVTIAIIEQHLDDFFDDTRHMIAAKPH